MKIGVNKIVSYMTPAALLLAVLGAFGIVDWWSKVLFSLGSLSVNVLTLLLIVPAAIMTLKYWK